MAQRIEEAKYEAMISALYAFANNVYSASTEMQSLTAVCSQALYEEDKAVPEIYAKIKGCQLKYAEACAQARAIAQAMREELEEQKKEDQVWANDE